jgi:hypothetical protein
MSDHLIESEFAGLRRQFSAQRVGDLRDHPEFGLAPEQAAPGPQAIAIAHEPCRGCATAPRCARLLLACREFVRFVENDGGELTGEFRRRPTRKIFNRVFPPTDTGTATSSYLPMTPSITQLHRPPGP